MMRREIRGITRKRRDGRRSVFVGSDHCVGSRGKSEKQMDARDKLVIEGAREGSGITHTGTGRREKGERDGEKDGRRLLFI